ncbi:hypothetical protein H4R35_006608 [Dimargaris xerosporica]|nr:hypothetical protein H4R35_006608 [Dimargaris xerosporica]
MALATSPPPVSRQRSIPPRTMPYARVPTEPTPGGRSSNPASNPASPSAQLSPSDSAAQTLLASPSPASPDLYIDVDPADTRPHATLAEQYPVDVLTRTSWWATRRWRQWLPVAGIFVLVLVFASIFWVYHKSILAWMEILGLKIRQTGFM